MKNENISEELHAYFLGKLSKVQEAEIDGWIRQGNVERLYEIILDFEKEHPVYKPDDVALEQLKNRLNL